MRTAILIALLVLGACSTDPSRPSLSTVDLAPVTSLTIFDIDLDLEPETAVVATPRHIDNPGYASFMVVNDEPSLRARVWVDWQARGTLGPGCSKTVRLLRGGQHRVQLVVSEEDGYSRTTYATWVLAPEVGEPYESPTRLADVAPWPGAW